MKTNSAIENFIHFLGPYKWPLAVLTLMVIGLAAYKAYQYFLLRKPDRKWLQSVLFWGIVTAALGLIGQVHGIWLSLNAIISADDISPPMVMVGFLSTFSPTLFGFVVGLIAVLAWWGLSTRQAHLERKLNRETEKS